MQSGKSALVHRYLTGSYMQEESPEGRVPALSALQIRANSVLKLLKSKHVFLLLEWVHTAFALTSITFKIRCLSENLIRWACFCDFSVLSASSPMQI